MKLKPEIDKAILNAMSKYNTNAYNEFLITISYDKEQA